MRKNKVLKKVVDNFIVLRHAKDDNKFVALNGSVFFVQASKAYKWPSFLEAQKFAIDYEVKNQIDPEPILIEIEAPIRNL